ncbi:hypothetical protein [Streptomyces benahoarensis]|uniref:Uncharacterized protein n=1 Tax=Streptomyces benahoarensis TaxID=2595054 RepID=A0A553ZM65_9ACTN|nr:hypothetical protein [Streptomyces benahoarensis]TSB22791.1 hypothetical protein FNJ62_15905 [Streptomyces benahoarensis]TSB42530.1 hypothetical protein FNZ23_09405 [Streptomyces benahoarensis]
MTQQRKKQTGATPREGASQPKRKATGRGRRLDHKTRQALGVEKRPRTYRPDEVLSPAALLARFTERAQELIAALPDDDQPAPAGVSAALRQAVLEAFRTREEYMARMVETDLLASAPGQSLKVLQRTIRSCLYDQGLRCIDSPGEQEHFVVVEGEGDGFEVLRPAYVDQVTGKLLLSGQLRRVPLPPQSSPDSRLDHAREEGEA